MRKVLIVSPKNIVMSSLIDELKKKAEIQTINEPFKALEVLSLKKFDLVVLTLELQGFDGIQLLSMMKSSQGINSTTPVVFISSDDAITGMFNDQNAPHLILKKDNKLISKFMSFFNSLPEPTKKHFHVLYIDDDKFIQKMIGMWFKKIDYITHEVCSSIEDLKLLENQKYDFVVSDNLLEDGEISDILDALKDKELDQTPILVYTGTAEKLDLKSLQKKANVLDVLPKPFELSEFLKRLETV